MGELLIVLTIVCLTMIAVSIIASYTAIRMCVEKNRNQSVIERIFGTSGGNRVDAKQ
jgi:hypothetical protein